MGKEVMLLLKVDEEDRHRFKVAATIRKVSMTQILRDFIKDFINRQESHGGSDEKG